MKPINLTQIDSFRLALWTGEFYENCRYLKVYRALYWRDLQHYSGLKSKIVSNPIATGLSFNGIKLERVCSSSALAGHLRLIRSFLHARMAVQARRRTASKAEN